jgi:hypothetical protein
MLVGWAPLAVLTVIREVLFGIPTRSSFLSDVNTHARFLIAVPLFIIAEGDVIPRFSRIARHFLSSGIVSEKDRARYFAADTSTRRLLNSKVAELVSFLLAYGAVFTLVLTVDRKALLPPWQLDESGFLGLSAAGLWHTFVGLPLLFTLIIGWFWRILLWWRFLARMSRLDLCLIPAHPDQAGGLGFVSTSIRGYRLLAFAIGSIVAGTEMSAVLRTGQPFIGYRNGAIAVAVLAVIMAAGPLTVFVGCLRAEKARGTFNYGALGRDLGFVFERKWFARNRTMDSTVLEVEDFSTTTDLYQVVRNVYEMKDVPFSLSSLQFLLVAAMLPFVPVALMAVPLKEILLALVKLVV